MSARYGQKALPSANKKACSFVPYNRDIPPYSGPVAASRPANINYVRPSDYATIPAIDNTQQKIILLVHISNDNSNYVNFVIGTGGVGGPAFTVNWGDGTPVETFNNGTTSCYHQYDYNDPDLNVNPTTSDGFKQAVVIIEPLEGKTIQDINFNVLPPGIFPAANVYTQPIEEIYISAPNLALLTMGSSVSTTPAYCRKTSYVNLLNSGNITSFSGLFRNMMELQRVDIDKTSAITTTLNMFNSCFSLKTVNFTNNVNFSNLNSTSAMFSSCYSLVAAPMFETRNVLDMSSMFASCQSLLQVPLYNTAKVTNMVSMFNSCSSLITVPLFNTVLVANMQSLFTGCSSLTTVPFLNTGNVLNISGMFSNCAALKTVPLFNTIKVTDMSLFFSGCSSLITVPLFDTRAVTSMANMFSACSSLKSVPFFNTTNVTSMQNMFINCFSLTSVPLFDTGNVLVMTSMFNSCYNIKTVPFFNTVKVTTMSTMFSNCQSLVSVPAFDTRAVTIMTNMFANCFSMVSIPAFNNINTTGSVANMLSNCFSLATLSNINWRNSLVLTNCKLSKEALETFFNNLGAANGVQTLTITNNRGAAGSIIPSGNITAGSPTITNMATVAGILTGMQITGTGTSLTTGRQVTFNFSGNTVSLNPVSNHGLQNGDEVAFSFVGGASQVVINTIYFVVNRTDTTFQVASSVGGTPLTTNPGTAGQLKYNATVISIGANSVTMSRPMAGSPLVESFVFRPLQTYKAILKGFTVTG
jgi:surface protein